MSSFNINGPNNKPQIQASQNMQNNGGGGNTGYMNVRKKKKDKKENKDAPKFGTKDERDKFEHADEDEEEDDDDYYNVSSNEESSDKDDEDEEKQEETYEDDDFEEVDYYSRDDFVSTGEINGIKISYENMPPVKKVLTGFINRVKSSVDDKKQKDNIFSNSQNLGSMQSALQGQGEFEDEDPIERALKKGKENKSDEDKNGNDDFNP